MSLLESHCAGEWYRQPLARQDSGKTKRIAENTDGHLLGAFISESYRQLHSREYKATRNNERICWNSKFLHTFLTAGLNMLDKRRIGGSIRKERKVIPRGLPHHKCMEVEKNALFLFGPETGFHWSSSETEKVRAFWPCRFVSRCFYFCLWFGTPFTQSAPSLACKFFSVASTFFFFSSFLGGEIGIQIGPDWAAFYRLLQISRKLHRFNNSTIDSEGEGAWKAAGPAWECVFMRGKEN